MQIFPAIDVRGGRCVRLLQGDYDRETVFGDDPAAMARRWVAEGATYLHIVDLDGAREGRPVNGDSVRQIVRAAGVPCQLGGGLRSEDHITQALEWGITRVILGTRALQDPAWLENVCRNFPARIVLDIAAKDGRVATEGWQHTSSTSALELARQCSGWPLSAIVYTDVRRDGMMGGPNLEALEEMARAVPIPVIASGGVSSLEDVRSLARLPLAGCIVGRALYEGKLNLAEALALAASP